MRRKAMKTGRFIWHDLMTLDAARARAFYAELFGWDLVPLSMGGFKIQLIEHTGRRIGAIMPEEAAQFYGALAGWRIEREAGPPPCWLVKDDERDFAGIMQRSAEEPERPAWLPYIGAANVDDSVRRALSLGATVLVEPCDIPKAGRFSV